MTTSPGELPVRIDVKSVGASADFVEKFGKHLVLIYTGKTRLARNLLQNVVRNWCVYLDTTFLYCRKGDCLNFFASRSPPRRANTFLQMPWIWQVCSVALYCCKHGCADGERRSLRAGTLSDGVS
jgi:hypothetical protein